MQKVHRGDGYVVSEKPSRITIQETLSNGQYMTMRFQRHRAKKNPDAIAFVWVVSLYIGSRKGATKWRQKKTKPKQTGECGMEGLKIALGNLQAFASGMSWREELQVCWEDDKRRRAYRWLLRYPGFVLHDHEEMKDKPFLAYRDPECWVWIPKEDENEHVL